MLIYLYHYCVNLFLVARYNSTPLPRRLAPHFFPFCTVEKLSIGIVDKLLIQL